MDTLPTLFQNSALFITGAALFGLIVGSFLNVVIHRLPIMLEKSWRHDCEEFMGLQSQAESPQPRFDLIYPHSHCPQCRHPIRAYENIPVISYLWLGGKCSQCKVNISLRYPLIEILTTLFYFSADGGLCSCNALHFPPFLHYPARRNSSPVLHVPPACCLLVVSPLFRPAD